MGEALGALDDVGGVLAGGQVERQQHVRVVRVRRAQAAGEHGADQVLADVQLHDRLGRGVQEPLDEPAGQHDLGDDVLAAAEDAVDGRGLLVRAVVAGDRAVPDAGHGRQDVVHQLVGGVGHHVVPGRVAGGQLEPHEQQVPGDLRVQVDQPREPAAARDDRGELVLPGLQVLPRGERDPGVVGLQQHGPGHPLVHERRPDPALDHRGQARAPADRRPQRRLVRGQRHLGLAGHDVAAHPQGADPAQGDGRGRLGDGGHADLRGVGERPAPGRRGGARQRRRRAGAPARAAGRTVLP